MSSDISSLSGAGGGRNGAPSVLQIKARQLVRPPTPETIITERHDDPDITIFCEDCRKFVSVSTMKEHRAYHNALLVLGYSAQQQPSSVKVLLKKRQTLMRDLNKCSDAENPMPFHILQKINEAYELVKAHLEDTFEELIHTSEKLVYKCQGISLNCSAPCVRSVGICSDDNCRWKPKMEDTRVFQDFFGNDINKCFFGIYDGYNGRFSADIAANDLHHIFLTQLKKVDDRVSCTCSVNLADKNDLTDYELGRDSPIVRRDSIRHILHEESGNIIQQIMHTCESNLVRLQDLESKDREVDTPMRKKKHIDVEAENVAQAFHNTYHILDRHLSFGINETSLVRWSGCSALTILIQSKETKQSEEECEKKKPEESRVNGEVIEKQDDEKDVTTEIRVDEKEGGKEKDPPVLEACGVLHLANAGNSHAMLCRAGKPYRLSKNHTPSNKHEKTRVENAGSSIQAGGTGGRINGILDTTRGLGNYGDPHLKKAVIPDPYTTSIKLDQYAEFVVMASCALWDVLTDEDIVTLVRQTLLQRQARTVMASVPDIYDQERSEVTGTLGEDYGGYYNDGLNASLGQLGFEDAMASVVDIDAAEDVHGIDKYQYKNPPAMKAEVANDADDEEEDNADTQITWNEPLTDGGTEKIQQEEKGVCEDVHGEGIERGVNESESENNGSSNMRNFKQEFNDASSVKTDFESMLSALCEDGNEADIETLTELHTYYAKSRTSDDAGQGHMDTKEEYRIAAEAISERLVQSALMAGSRDNITVMVILLEGCKL